MSSRQGPRVRGTCPRGHVIETNATHKRVTWSGPCPGVDGEACGMHVLATRIPTAGPSPDTPPPEPPPPSSPPGGGAGPIPKVESYVEPAAEPGFADPADGPPVGKPTGVQDTAEPAPDERPPGPGDHDGDSTPGPAAPASELVVAAGEAEPRRRRFFAKAAGSEFDDGPESWTAPGCYP